MATRRRPFAGAAAVCACLVWIGLWSLTPGLLADGPGRRLVGGLEVGGLDAFAVGVLAESLLAVVVLVVLLILHRDRNRHLFARSRVVPFYAVPVVLAAVLPFHYGMEDVPLGVYLVWMTVSVLWQDYLTFGLLQSYLREVLSPWATVLLVAIVFWVGHAVFIPHRFGLDNPLAGLAMIGLGVLFASIRTKTGTLHLLLVLHASFYFLLA